MAKRESLGRCPLCRRHLWRPVRTVRAKDRLYHATCWREAKPPSARPVPISLSEALDRLDPGRVLPKYPLPRAETLAILLEMPMDHWMRRRLEQAQQRT